MLGSHASKYFLSIHTGRSSPVSDALHSFADCPPSEPATVSNSVAEPRSLTSLPCLRVHLTATPAVMVTSPSVPSPTKPPSFEVTTLVTANWE